MKPLGLKYKTANNLAVFPENNPDDVQLCAKRLGLNLKQRFAFKLNPLSNKKGAIKHPFQTPTTIEEALMKFVDLTGQLSKRTLKDLGNYCSDEDEKKR